MLEQSFLFHVRVGDGDDFNFNIGAFLKRVENNHKVAHGVEGAAALAHAHQHNFELAAAVGLLIRRHCLQVVDNVARPARVNILSAEVDFGQAFALFGRPRVPEFAAENIEQNFVTEEGAADTERDNRVDIVADFFGEVVQAFDGRGRVQIKLAVLFGDVGQLGEVNFFGRAVFAEVGFDEAAFAHDFHSLVGFGERVFAFVEVGLSNFAFAEQIIIVEAEARFQSKSHCKTSIKN